MGFDIEFNLDNGTVLSPCLSFFENFLEVTLELKNSSEKKSFIVPGEHLFEFGTYVLFKSSYLKGNPSNYFKSDLRSVESFLPNNYLHSVKPMWLTDGIPLVLQSFEGDSVKVKIYPGSSDHVEMELEYSTSNSTRNLTLDPFDYIKILKKLLYVTNFGEDNQNISAWVKKNI